MIGPAQQAREGVPPCELGGGFRAAPAFSGEPLKLLSLFSGIGGFDLGLETTGAFETVAACDINPYSRAVFARHWPHVRQYSDVRALTAATLAGDGITVDAICAGFPCQDLSFAGKRAGIEGARSGLWSEVARLVGELRPRVVLLENVSGILSAGLGRVLGDLAALGYDAVWDCIPASAIGAPHRRDRWMCVAYATQLHCNGSNAVAKDRSCKVSKSGNCSSPHDVAHAISARQPRPGQSVHSSNPEARGQGQAVDAFDGGFADIWSIEPNVGRVADGVPNRVDRLTALGNAIVPQWAYLAGVWAIAILNELEVAYA